MIFNFFLKLGSASEWVNRRKGYNGEREKVKINKNGEKWTMVRKGNCSEGCC